MNRRKSLKLMAIGSISMLFPFRLLSNVASQVNNVCKNAWESLSKFTAKRYQFRYIEPKIDLPNVFIYGDSISIGYTEYVRASLKGKASVYRLHVNGGASDGFISKMEKLRKTMFQPFLKGGWNFEWDLIHFNVGLHDLKYAVQGKLDKVNGTQISTLNEYEKNLHSIIKYLKETYPNVKLIFATTTPVPEGEPGRIVGDDIKFNQIALKVMKDYKGITINDLYTFSIPVLEKHNAGNGNVHYEHEGARLQGIRVAEVISEQLGITTNECPSTKEIISQLKQYEGKI